MKTLNLLNRWTVTCAAIVCMSVGMMTVPAQADVMVFRQFPGDVNFGGTDYTATSTVFDDKWVPGLGNNNSYASTNFMGVGGPSNVGESEPGGNSAQFMMIAISEMFSLLPASDSGMVIQINSATLRVHRDTRWGNTEGNEVTAFRVATDWLLGQAPGAAQYNSNRRYTDMANELPWADEHFGPSDIDTSSASPAVTWNTATEYNFDVTSIVQDMYASGDNFGFVLAHTSGEITTSFIRARQSTTPVDGQDVPLELGPSLFIDYTYVVPEPASLGLLGLGSLVMLARRRARD